MAVFRAALGFAIALALAEPHAFMALFETPRIVALKVDLANAERDEARRFDESKATPFDIAIFRTAASLRASARSQ